MTDYEFSILCFLVLVCDKPRHHFDYINEKFQTVIGLDPVGALSKLDTKNRQKVFEYMNEWGFELPNAIKALLPKMEAK